jgi:hypothetical protein
MRIGVKPQAAYSLFLLSLHCSYAQKSPAATRTAGL